MMARAVLELREVLQRYNKAFVILAGPQAVWGYHKLYDQWAELVANALRTFVIPNVRFRPPLRPY